MNRKKGMSQVLSLIVAASVLMMTALTLILAAQGSISDLIGGSARQECISTINGQCSVGVDSISTPAACDDWENFDTSSIDGAAGTTSGGSQITCS
jgi:hypothetical protein